MEVAPRSLRSLRVLNVSSIPVRLRPPDGHWPRSFNVRNLCRYVVKIGSRQAGKASRVRNTHARIPRPIPSNTLRRFRSPPLPTRCPFVALCSRVLRATTSRTRLVERQQETIESLTRLAQTQASTIQSLSSSVSRLEALVRELETKGCTSQRGQGDK